jgi:hypothetical protein
MGGEGRKTMLTAETLSTLREREEKLKSKNEDAERAESTETTSMARMSGALFVAQRYDRIDLHRPARGDVDCGCRRCQ